VRGEPRIAADVPVAGRDYDDLVAAARARALELLGPDRGYWLEIRDVAPAGTTGDGSVPVWEGIARIAAPHDAVEF
jgi:hypothetical protein